MIYHSCHELPFTQIHIVDTEFCGDHGDQKTPVCLVVRELLSGEVRRCWMDELRQMDQPPSILGQMPCSLPFLHQPISQCF